MARTTERRRWRPVIGGVLLAWAGQVLFRAGARRFLRLAIAKLNAGDARWLLATFAEDSVLIFPGRNSWAGEYRGKAGVREFLERFMASGLQFSADEIDIAGPPWATRVHLEFHDWATDQHGVRVYENSGVIAVRLRWGRIVEQRDHEVTELAADFDHWLADHGDGRARAWLAAHQPAVAVAPG